jgi:glycosyltransferase involved in cell wall biosynthesis
MKILHVVPTYLPATRYGGPIRSVHGLCKALAKTGHEVHVFTTNVDGPGDSDVPLGMPANLDGVSVWYFPSHQLRRLYWSRPLAKTLEQQINSFDIVHLHSVFLWPTWIAARIARKANIPYLIAPRGMLVRDLIERKNRWLKLLWITLIERLNLERAQAIHVTSPIEKDNLLNFRFNLRKIFELPNGIDTEEMLPADVPVVEGRYILYLGRINWKKGLENLVSAMTLVSSAKLVIAGNDEEDFQPILEEKVVQSGLTDRVEFLGPVSGAVKWRLFQDAQVFVLPSISENFGIAVLEAMAMECAVVVSPGVGLAAEIQVHECGVVAEAEPAAIAHSLNDLLDDPLKREQMGKRGKILARERFTWEIIALETEQAYREITQKYHEVTATMQSRAS